MNGDEILATEPSRGSPIRLIVAIGLIAFLGGLAVMALVLRFWLVPAPQVAPVQPPAPVRAGPPVPTGTDIATLYSREEMLAQRLNELEGRLTGIDQATRTASGFATRAEGMMIAFAARRAIDRGLPLGYVEGQLDARFRAVAPQAVATIIQSAREPVTVEDLRLAIDRISPNLVSASPSDSLWTRLLRQLNTLVVIRQESSPSPRATDRMLRIRRLISSGHVQAAMAEVSRLPGSAHAESWMAAATRYVDTRRALDTIELAAIQGRTAPATGPVQPVPGITQ